MFFAHVLWLFFEVYITHATQHLMQSMSVYLIPSPEMETHIPGL